VAETVFHSGYGPILQVKIRQIVPEHHLVAALCLCRGGRHCEYIPGKWGELEAQRMLPIPARRYQEIHASAIESAPLASGVMPVLVLLPGMGRIPAHYTTLAEDLASYGYVIVGVTPTGSSRPVVFSDGRVVEGSEFDPDVESRAQAQQLIETWAADASFSLDQLCREPHFAARLHLNRTGIFGHSFGGDVAAHALRLDSKFSRAASLDGGPPFFGDSITRLDRPLLILEGGPEIHRTACDFDRTNCTIRSYADARHMNFSDAGILPSRLPFPKSLMMLGDVDGAQFLRDVSDRLRDFFSQM
jgi:dienelactone hydrolase